MYYWELCRCVHVTSFECYLTLFVDCEGKRLHSLFIANVSVRSVQVKFQWFCKWACLSCLPTTLCVGTIVYLGQEKHESKVIIPYRTGKWNLRDYGLCQSLPSRYMQTGKQAGRQADRQTKKRAIRQADRQTNTLQTGRSADWRTDRHTDRYIRPQQFSWIKQHLMLVVKINAVRVKRRPWISKAEHLWWGEKWRHPSQCL